LLAHLSTGKSDGAFKGEGKGAWLSANRENIRTFYANPKRQAFTCNGFENLFKLMKYTYKKKRYQVKNPNLPIHFVSGGDDPLIGNAVKWVNGIELLRKVGYANVTGKLYQGMRHEIFHEAERETVLAELLAFIVA